MNGTNRGTTWMPSLDTFARANWIANEAFPTVSALIPTTLFYTYAGTSWLDLSYIGIALYYLNRSTLGLYIYPTILSIVVLFLPSAITIAGYHAFSPRNSYATDWKGPGRPYLIPCKTTHTRFFPQKHSFAYSYLTVGIPIGFQGSANGMIGVDEQLPASWWGKCPFSKLLWQSWYHVESSDHLQRGHEDLTLRGKLDLYLKSEGVDPADYPHAYLVTAAKFAGYHFNPVSFWYLYSSEKLLSGIVLEVNNTFDERRPYLVLRDFTSESNSPDTRSRVSGSQVKDFHVSPFNSRKGSYSVQASDPFGPGMSGFLGIDVKIVLNSSRGHPKLVARLFSEGDAIDPTTLNLLSKAMFISRYFWVGFVTFPRIVKEAGVLLFRRKLRMWTKPEPLSATLGRHTTSTEMDIEAAFRRYLESLVYNFGKPLSLKYYTSGMRSETEITFTSSHGPGSEEGTIVELRVLTPDFYSRFVHYEDCWDGMTTEFNEHKTISMINTELLRQTFATPSPGSQQMSFSDSAFAGFVRHLRRKPSNMPSNPAPILERTTTQPSSRLSVGHTASCVSSMDQYMTLSKDGNLKKRYQWAVARQMMADRYLVGQVWTLSGVMNLVRMGIALMFASSLTHLRTCLA